MYPMKTRIRLRLFAVLFWLLVWEGLSLLVAKPLLLPSPAAVLVRFAALALTARFWGTVGLTLLRILCGALAGTLLGIVLAAGTSRFRVLNALVSPLLTVIKATPVVSFIILVLLWAGRDFVPSLIVILMVLPVVWSNVSAGIAGCDRQLLECARVFRFSRRMKLRRLYLPSVLPHLLSACRSALGLAWKAGVAAEVLTVPAVSIGKMLYESKLYLETTELFAWTLAVIVCSLVIEKVLTVWMTRLAGKLSGGRIGV